MIRIYSFSVREICCFVDFWKYLLYKCFKSARHVAAISQNYIDMYFFFLLERNCLYAFRRHVFVKDISSYGAWSIVADTFILHSQKFNTISSCIIIYWHLSIQFAFNYNNKRKRLLWILTEVRQWRWWHHSSASLKKCVWVV